MATRKWIFSLDGKQHELLLKHGPIPGREIWLDGQLVEKGRTLVDYGSEHHFEIDGHAVELGIVSNMIGYEYYLRVNDEFVFPASDARKTIGKFTQKKMEARQKWLALGQAYGLEYRPMEVKQFTFQHRLIGHINGYLAVAIPGFKHVGNTAIAGIWFFFRHATLEPEKSKEILNDEKIKSALKEWKTPKEYLEINQDFTALFFRTMTKKETETIIFERIYKFLSLVSLYLKPKIEAKCEGMECKIRIGQDLQLVLINNIPQMLCKDCIEAISDIGKKVEQEYKQQPDNLLKGIIYGAGAMLLGALVWALAAVFLDTISAIFAVLIFILVMKFMDYAKTKRTFKSLLAAGLLSLGGAVIGTYLGLAGYLLKEGKIEFSLNDLIWVAQKMFAEPKLLNQALIFSLIGLVPYLFITWSSTRQGLKRYFKPEVEVIPNLNNQR